YLPHKKGLSASTWYYNPINGSIHSTSLELASTSPPKEGISYHEWPSNVPSRFSSGTRPSLVKFETLMTGIQTINASFNGDFVSCTVDTRSQFISPTQGSFPVIMVASGDLLGPTLQGFICG